VTRYITVIIQFGMCAVARISSEHCIAYCHIVSEWLKASITATVPSLQNYTCRGTPSFSHQTRNRDPHHQRHGMEECVEKDSFTQRCSYITKTIHGVIFSWICNSSVIATQHHHRMAPKCTFPVHLIDATVQG